MEPTDVRRLRLLILVWVVMRWRRSGRLLLSGSVLLVVSCIRMAAVMSMVGLGENGGVLMRLVVP